MTPPLAAQVVMPAPRTGRSGRFAQAGLAAVLLATLLAGCVTTHAPEPEQRPVPTLPDPEQEQVRIKPGEPPRNSFPRPSRGNPPFYDVMGERYHVLPDSQGYVEQGVASWYGREFHGRLTSNGEVYDMYALTAAHKTLPLPSTVRVTNLATGKSIVVQVNDRGPFKKGRIIDLSYAAARDLGFVSAGTALVEVRALPDVYSGGRIPGAPAETPAQAMYVQVGAFGQRQNALDLKNRLESQGFGNVVIRHDGGAQPPMYRVRVGPVQDAAEYDAVVSRVSRLNVSTPRLVVETADTKSGAAPATQDLPGG